LIVTKEQNPITSSVRIPGLSHTTPQLPTTPARSPEKQTGKGEGNGQEIPYDERVYPPLKEGTVCVSGFVTEADIEAMPSLEAPLTRKRRRASSTVETFVQLPDVKSRGRKGKDVTALENVLINGVASSSGSGLKDEKKKTKLKSEKLVNGVNGHKSTVLVSIPNGFDKKKSHKVVEKLKENVRGKDGKKEREKDDRERDLERNIDNVIFGDVTFKAWYPSWYPKEIIGEKALSCEGKGPGITVKELYICRRCFGYSKSLVDWVRHCRCCEREVPGRKVYSHGAEGEGGGWSVWEVDGGIETVSAALPSQSCVWIGANASDATALLPKSIPLRKAFPRQQIRLLRRLRIQLLPPRAHLPPHSRNANYWFLLQGEDVLG
jgi:MYST family zinc finger domain